MNLLLPRSGTQHPKPLRKFVAWAVICVILSSGWAWGPIFAQVAGPTLSIPQAISATAGQPVTVPLNFQSGGTAVASTVFAIDFDQSCLGFDASDHDHDGMPDNVHFNLPAAFRGAVTYAAADVQGELDFVIADYAPPIATLPDRDGLVTITFTPLCTPAADASLTAAVGFAHAPLASFGRPDGDDLSGATSDGAVVVRGSATAPDTPGATPPPDATLTPNATPQASATIIPTAPDLPTATATGAVTVTVTPAATAITGQTDQTLHIFLPWLQR